MDQKNQKKLLDNNYPLSKKFKALIKFSDSANPEELKQFYSQNFSLVYNIFLDNLSTQNSQAKAKKKPIAIADVLQCTKLLLNLFKYARNIIQKKWQQKSIIHYLECFLEDTNAFAVKKAGFELMLHFNDILQDQNDPKVLDLLMHCLDFSAFVEHSEKLPAFDVRAIGTDERLLIQPGTGKYSEEESLQIMKFFFDFVKTGDQFEFWWKFFKQRLAPILYPNECKSLELLNKLDDMGFVQRCPYKIHVQVLDMILDSLESPKKCEVLYATDKDIYLFLLIFRQSFLLPPIHFENISKMLKTYRSWIVRDHFVYQWPEIMEKSRNLYFRVFIDNLSQSFFMKGDEGYIDIHVAMCYEVLEILKHFINIADKVEFETWNDLLLAHIKIYHHLMQRKNASEDKYDVEFGKTLEKTCIRNLFVIWLKAHPGEDYVDLWDGLYDLLQRYMAEDSVFAFWRTTVINLTKLIMTDIFKLPDDTPEVGAFLDYSTEIHELVGKKNKKKSSRTDTTDLSEYFLDLPDDIVLHLWHKMIKNYGKDNTQNTTGPIHAKKMGVIAEVIDYLLQISQIEVKVVKGAQTPPFVHSPEANRMLELFIEWLVESSIRLDADFATGRCKALESFCKIMCQKSSQPIQKRYLAEFYRIVRLGLNPKYGSTSNTIASILMNSQNLFSLGYPGVNLLIPDYLKAIELLLKGNSTASNDLKVACVNILASIISPVYFYEDQTLPSLDIDELKKVNAGTDNSEDLSSFKKIRVKIQQLLLTALDENKIEEVQIKCIWALLLVLQRELATSEPTNIQGICDSYTNYAFDKSEKVAITVHMAFQSMAQLGLLKNIEEAIFSRTIIALCTIISVNLNENKLVRGNVLVHLFYTILEMVVYIPQTEMQKPSNARALFGAVAAGLAQGKMVDPAERKKIQANSTVSTANASAAKNKSLKEIQTESAVELAEAAESLLAFLLNHYNNFPFSSEGASFSSSDFTELELLDEEKGNVVPSQKLHHFVFNDYTLITIMESPTSMETARMICRDMTGKYCWEMKFTITPSVSTFPRKEAIKEDEEEAETPSGTPVPAEDSTLNGDVEATEENNEENMEENKQNEEEAENTEAPVEEEEDDDGMSLPKPVNDRRKTISLKQSTIQSKAPGSSPASPAKSTTAAPSTQQTNASTTSPAPKQPSSQTAPAPQAVVKKPEPKEAQDSDYPIYDPSIDTDKTDMFDVLNSFISQVYPDVAQFATKSVISIPDQHIDDSEVKSKMEAQIQTENQLLKETEIVVFDTCKQPLKKDSVIYKAFRAFLNHMGLLSSTNKAVFTRLESNHKLYRSLKQLDKSSDREAIKIGLLYVKNGQEMERVILKNDGDCTAAYKEFVQGLGWSVDLRTHPGFLGGLDNSTGLSTGETAPYFSNATTEVIFHDITRMPTKANDAQQIHKKRHVGNDNVHIIWSENDRDYRPWTIVSQFNFVHIVVYPLKHPFFRIQIFSKPEVPSFGPLFNGMVVDKEFLAPLVRLTAINANKAVRYNQAGYKKPYPTRKNFINEIIERHKLKNMTNEEFKKQLFVGQSEANDIVQSYAEQTLLGRTLRQKSIDTQQQQEDTPAAADNQ